MNASQLSCIVTGAARGIGRATALRLLSEGASVALWDRDRDALDSLTEELRSAVYPPARATAVVCDVTDADNRRNALERTAEHFGKINGLINNAGTFVPGNFRDVPLERRRLEIELNFVSVVELTYEVLPYLQVHDSAILVNVASAAAYAGAPGLAVYSATKSAVWMFTEGLRNEAYAAGRRNVHFASVHPNFVREGLFAGAHLGGIGQVFFPSVKRHDDVARAIVRRAIRRRRNVVSIPFSLRGAVLFRGILPDALFARLSRVFGLHSSMRDWKGERDRRGEEEA
ncbi:MAG: SDR family NAD(P)-dependent oxidoreductase [Spirochaetia bacterium]